MKFCKLLFSFYISRGLGIGIDVQIFATTEKKAREKLDKIIMPEFDAKLQKVIEKDQ